MQRERVIVAPNQAEEELGWQTISREKGDTFEAATDDAWKKAKDHGKEPGLYKVKHIFVLTENPIREYRGDDRARRLARTASTRSNLRKAGIRDADPRPLRRATQPAQLATAAGREMAPIRSIMSGSAA